MTDTHLPSTGAKPADLYRFTSVDFALYAAIVLAWSTSWYPLSLQVGVVAPEVSLVWRFLGAGVLMFGYLLYSGRQIRFALADHVRFAMLGILLFSTNFALFYYASATGLASGLLSVIFSTASIINLILTTLVTGARPEGRVALGAILGLCGIALVFWPEIAGTSFNRSALFGVALGLCGTLSFCLGNILSASNQKRGLSVISANAWCMIYGAIWMAVVALFRGQTFAVEWTGAYLGSLAFLTLSSSILAFAVYLTLIGRIGAARAGYATVIFPIFALLISTVLEGYQWTGLSIAGLVLVVAGNYFVLSRKRA
ncbi:MAG: DMT family transporter [Pseudomonadota bacterium]